MHASQRSSSCQPRLAALAAADATSAARVSTAPRGVAGRARRVDDGRRVRVRHVARALGVGDERGPLDRGQPRVQQQRGHAQLQQREQRDDARRACCRRRWRAHGRRARRGAAPAVPPRRAPRAARTCTTRPPQASAAACGESRRGGADRQRVAHPRGGRAARRAGAMAAAGTCGSRAALLEVGVLALPSLVGHVVEERRVAREFLQPGLAVAVGVERRLEAAQRDRTVREHLAAPLHGLRLEPLVAGRRS